MATTTVYEKLSRVRILSKSYTLKFLFIAFLGIHIPLIGIILYLLFGPPHLQPLSVFFVTLFLTLGATVVTLYLLNGLLTPLSKAKKALEDYLSEGKLPHLPTTYKDEAGVLMEKVQCSLTALDNALEEKKDIASLLSHDLKQPLSIIGTSAELINTTEDLTIVKKFSNNISHLVKEQIHLLEDVLQLLQYNSLFASDEQMTVVPVENFVEDIVEAAQLQAGLKNITIDHKLYFDGLLSVHLELFRQVLKNLLHNAIKFSYENSVITISVYEHQQAVCFSIKDKGKGFDPSVKDILFDRFTKARQQGTNNESSTGIGLHICQKIIKLHNGIIKAESEGIGRGATFTIVLPSIAETKEEMQNIEKKATVAA